jgi:hypothetical protein
MRVALASHYRNWMVALFPTTLGIGTAALWVRALNWPLIVDESGVMLRSHRRIGWHSIRKIGLSRSYLDGHVSQIRIHHEGGCSIVALDKLRDGELVVRVILRVFERANRQRSLNRRTALPVSGSRLAARSPQADASSQADTETLAEIAMLIPEVATDQRAEFPRVNGSQLANYDSPSESEPPFPSTEPLNEELATLRQALARRAAKLKSAVQLEKECA